MKNYYITHFFNTLPPGEGVLKPLTIIVATRESLKKGIYYFGYGGSRRISKKELKEELINGTIIELPKPLFSNKSGLWLDQGGNVIKASADNPMEGREIIYSIPIKKRSELIYNNVFTQSEKGIPDLHNVVYA